MNKIESVIRPEKLTEVIGALSAAGFLGLNIVNVTGHGGETSVRAGNRGTTSLVVNLLPKVKLEIVVRDAETQKVVDIIGSTARTRQMGDGKIFISPVTTAVRVRTGEQGAETLQVNTEK